MLVYSLVYDHCSSENLAQDSILPLLFLILVPKAVGVFYISRVLGLSINTLCVTLYIHQ